MGYRDDEQAQAYKRIADLEEENRKLRVSATSQARPRREWKLPTVDFERLFTWTGWIALVLAGAGLSYIIGSALLADGHVDYCYVEHHSMWDGATIVGDNYFLKGHKPWREDIQISRHDSIVNAYKAAEMLKCPLLKK